MLPRTTSIHGHQSTDEPPTPSPRPLKWFTAGKSTSLTPEMPNTLAYPTKSELGGKQTCVMPRSTTSPSSYTLSILPNIKWMREGMIRKSVGE
jgi:hypothetical protein